MTESTSSEPSHARSARPLELGGGQSASGSLLFHTLRHSGCRPGSSPHCWSIEFEARPKAPALFFGAPCPQPPIVDGSPSVILSPRNFPAQRRGRRSSPREFQLSPPYASAGLAAELERAGSRPTLGIQPPLFRIPLGARLRFREGSGGDWIANTRSNAERWAGSRIRPR